MSSAHNTAGAVQTVTTKKLGFIHAQSAETASLLPIRHIDTQSRPLFVYLVCGFSQNNTRTNESFPILSTLKFTLFCNLASKSIYLHCTGFAYSQSAVRLNEHAIMLRVCLSKTTMS